MIETYVIDDNIDAAIRVFKKSVSRSGILQELKARRSFESKMEKRRRKDAINMNRLRKMQKREHGYR